MRVMVITRIACATLVIGVVLAQAETPVERTTPRVCITEPAGYYGDSTELIRRRLDCYRELGVETLRVESGWENGALPEELKRTDLRVKLILYVLGIPPDYGAQHADEALVDQHGTADWHLGPWHRDVPQLATQGAQRQIERLKALGVLDRIDEVVADLGPAGEGIYPANWTLGRDGQEAFWCYGEAAQVDFRKAMQRRYGDVDAANDAWKLTENQRFGVWDTVRIPQPGTAWAQGPFWGDMLAWYRDAKRRMMEFQIDNTLRITRKYLGDRAKVIVYLPGYAYSQEEWDQAVATAGGSSSIRLMMDNDWLMDKALEKGCLLQYTGAENSVEVARIAGKLKSRGIPDCHLMWGENAGREGAGRDPMWLAQVVCAYDLRGVDFTWASWLFRSDHITPSPTYAEFARAAKAIRHCRETGELPAPSDCGVGTVRKLASGRYELTPNADTRLMGSYPDVIKGRDPEIAVVEGGQTQRMLFRFPLDLLPTGREVNTATLTLRSFVDYHDETTAPVNVYRISEAWQEHAATWRARTLTDDWKHPGGDAVGPDETRFQRSGDAVAPYASTTVDPLKPGQAVQWDVTQLCREWTSGQAANYGMMLSLESPKTANKSIASKDHADPVMRPKLVVELTGAPWSVTSPGGNLLVTVVLENLDDPYPDEEGLYFSVSANGRQVLPFSPLGVTMRDADFVRDLKPVRQTDRVIDETYPMPSGKKSTHYNRANETTLIFENGQGNAMHVVFRAYNDGIAYRYHFPGAGTREIMAEASAFRLPPGSAGWFQPYSSNHETLYTKHVGRQADAEDATTDMGLELRFSKVSGVNAVVAKIELWSDQEPSKPVQRIKAKSDLDPPDGFHLVACDDCGFESLQPHCTDGLDFVYSEEHVPYSIVAADDPARSVSFGWDSVLYRFAELAPEARYKLFVTYLSHDDTRVMALSANGHPLHEAFTLPKQKVTVRQFEIPRGIVGEIPRPSGHDVGFPALVHTPSDAWVLLTEAAVYGDYGGAHLVGSLDGPSIFRVTLPQELSGELPWTTPWRVALVGEELGTIVESVLVDNLNPPCEVEDTSWITPGRVTFPWWSDTAVSGNFERLKEFVDLAHRMGWEWIEFDTALVHGRPDCSLTDAWMTLPWVAELVEYARRRNVKVYGWDHWQNLDTPEKREKVLGRFQELGIEGVKIDFLESDSQQRFQFRDEVIRDCL